MDCFAPSALRLCSLVVTTISATDRRPKNRLFAWNTLQGASTNLTRIFFFGNQKGSKRKTNKEKRQRTIEKEDYSPTANKNESVLDTLQEILRNFILQQQKIDMEWRDLKCALESECCSLYLCYEICLKF